MKQFLKRAISYIIPKKLFTLIYDIYVPYIKNTNPKNYAEYGHHIDLNPPLHLYSSQVYLGDYCRLQPGITMISNKGTLKIKKYSSIGAKCVIIPDAHTPTIGLPQYLSKIHVNDKNEEIVIEEDCWIGAGCYLLSHSRIRRGAIIAAGSVVTKEIPPYAVVAGSPAKIIAVRFSLEQIIKHETILYPPKERMTKKQLINLFETFYKDKKNIGTDYISPADSVQLINYKTQIGMPIYE